MTTAQLQLTAHEYLRVSADKSGRMRSTTDQHRDHQGIAREQGWALGAAYVEDGAASASRYGAKQRKGFAALTGDLEAGRFGADVLLPWESSRGSRKTWEWVRLIEALKDRRVRVFVASDERMYDCANARDRKSLRDGASDSEYESDKISARVRRGMASSALAGRPHGRVPYGYRREYFITGDGERDFRQVPDLAEAGVARRIVGALAAAHSLRSLAAAFNAEGIPTRRGGLWTPGSIRDIATNPAIIGMRLHVPGRRGGHRTKFGPADLIAGTWPALVDAEQFWRVHALMTDPARKTSRPGRGKHLASMIAVCGVCGGPMSVRYERDAKRKGGTAGTSDPVPDYWCRDRSCVRIDQAETDAALTALTVTWLSDPAHYGKWAPEETSAELQAARDELAAAQAHHRSLVEQVKARKLSPVMAAEAEPAALADINAAAKRVRELETPADLRDLVGEPGDDVAARWAAAPMTARRAVLRILYSEIAMHRSPSPGHRAGVTDRLTVAWRVGA